MSLSRSRKALLALSPCSCSWPTPSPLRLASSCLYSTSSTPLPTPSPRPQRQPRPVAVQRTPGSRQVRRALATLAVDRPGPIKAYNDKVAAGTIQDDAHQRSIITVLQDMYDRLEGYSPPNIPEPLDEPTSFFSKLFGTKATVPAIPEHVPLGLYLHGSVGCGKSFLMDLFYANLPPAFEDSKRRVHFHAFMMDVHKRGHRLKAENGLESDWIVHVARELAREARVLCFDEFQVTDIADAMILRRLMESLMGYGIVAVMTSNRVPDDLYKNGIQREQFLPCIELIKQRFVVKCLDSDIDYRKMPRALSKVYFSPVTPENKAEFTKLFDALTSDEPVEAHKTLTVWGRQIDVPVSNSNVARFSFPELCGRALSAADYLEITKTFETVFLTDVPLLTLNQKDQARRFILFIDAAYEAKTKIFVLSDPPINSVFSDKKDGNPHNDISEHQRTIMDDLGLSADSVGASSIFTGDEEVFAFARAVSRLSEMGSVQWSQSGRQAPVDQETAAQPQL